ncbi:VOC family protein [Alkalicoccus urumqiensis]|uniref:VOC family protein n=2 Tax=Alkalicoccus urumqiensis TaxID=1548213 RepID=A0A2P6MIJ3_ALKUR|nr:VOC family protein [Alkalicoccus urumqiensis]
MAYTVTDMEKTLDFYTRVLGLDYAFQVTKDDGSPWIEYVRAAPKQYIEFFYGGSGNVPAASSGPHHLCLLIEDAEAAAEKLKQENAPVTAGPKRGIGGNTQVWTEDPDGNKIELLAPDSDSPHNQ